MNWNSLFIGFILIIGGGEKFFLNNNENLSNNVKYCGVLGSPVPPNKVPPRNINPYILHWEPAHFERAILDEAHQNHLNRRKRDLNSVQHGPVNTIKLTFSAHDRDFNLVLHQNPLSVFAPDVEIENSLGPLDYDITRIYTGSLDDDENSHVQAVLTSDNLLDGTIFTKSEQYYIEPSNRYSIDLYKKSGIHTIVYKLSDVKMKYNKKNWMPSTNSSEHCASEKLRKKILLRNDFKRRKKFKLNNTNNNNISNGNLNSNSDNKFNMNGDNNNNNNNNNNEKENNNNNNNNNNENNNNNNNNNNNENNKKISKNFNKNQSDNKILNDSKNLYYHYNLKDFENDLSISHNRRKRWLPEELTTNRDPPLPLDLDVPYNDDYSLFDHNLNHDEINRRPGYNSRDNIIKRNFNLNNNNYGLNSQNNYGQNIQLAIHPKTRHIISNQYIPTNDQLTTTTTTHRNIIGNIYNENQSSSSTSSTNTKFRTYFNTPVNITTGGSGSSSSSIINNSGSRPIHKTHVEIITKNGATKKPNIIVNNYNPDVIIQTTNNNNNNNNNHFINRHNDFMDLSSTHSNLNSARSSYDRKSTCMLYLQADHTFFQKMGSDEASIEAITRHVQRANSIYRNTDFNGDGKPDNITFMIKRIKVHNLNALKDPLYRFPGNYGVEKFLELFSEEDYDAFCLAYMFTYRDFEMGTLGLAWTGDLKNAGGVCEKNGHYRGSLKSLNTGIVTLLNYGKHVPPAVSHVTLAHEIGHNFGSPHDPEQCTPGGEDGNYIMFARATSGDKRNNNKFSPCSLKSIEPVLNAKARSSKGCFTEPQTSICGNGVVEPGEQCDCGWEEDCKDDCCFPMSRHPRMDEKPCTLQPRAMCSPSQGPCCTNQCSLKFGDKCRDDNGCRDPSFCDGRMPQCPPSVNKPNKTICNKEFVCYMGECTGSICLAYGLESCQCLPGPNDPKTKSCELCCKLPGEGTPCKSSFQWNEPPYDVPDMFAKPGTPCNDYNGYCDVFQKCREVDPSGPLATLRKLLLSEESIASFKKWIQTNWYTVVLAAIGVIILLILSTKLLGKRNVKLKSVTIIHSATTETVRLPEDNNGVIVHTAVRTKVPFKKKVRGQRSHGSKQAKEGLSKQKNIQPNSNQTNNATTGVIPKTKRSSDVLLKKVSRAKKNRVSAPPVNDESSPATKLKEIKTKKVNKKHKEIIDYSKGSGGPSNSANHTNTFGKVQKWLLDSPIVAQPLSHIEHSSKVRTVMSKSQSTPERLVQKSPQKTKSVGNLANEKVKLQVVYKPPFKFSLKLSKNSAVKTHVIGASGKLKRKQKSGGIDKKRIGPSKLIDPIVGSNGRRAALLIRSADEENQDLTGTNNLEHNYETLNPKTKDTTPLYENMQYPNNDQDLLTKDLEMNSSNSNSNNTDFQPSTKNAFRVTRSASNSNIQRSNKSKQDSYSRSNSVSHKPSGIQIKPLSNKNSENSINLSRNFGSTQNLIQPNLTKSKKRNSLNLKNSNSNLDIKRSNGHPKRSNSNLNLKRENSSTNLRRLDGTSTTNLLKLSSQSINRLGSSNGIGSSNNNNNNNSNNINNNNNNNNNGTGSISNIPRASLSNNPMLMNNTLNSNSSKNSNNSGGSGMNNFNGSHRTPTPTNLTNNNNRILFKQQSLNPSLTNNLNNINLRPHTAGVCDDANRKFEWPSNNLSNSNNKISNSISSNNFEQLNNRNLLDMKQDDSVLDTDLEVMVSDVENLVS